MADRLSYRSCHPVSPEQEAAVRRAAAPANEGQAWVLVFQRDAHDGHLAAVMRPSDEAAAGGWSNWPGPFEAQRLLDALCAISRDYGVDWEVHGKYALRPVGVIRGGVCHADNEAMAEAARNMGEVYRRGSPS